MSGIIYESETGEGLGRFMIDLGDGRNMTVNVTEEGIIMDVYSLDEDDGVRDHYHLGTVGMMFDEWADWLVQFDKERDVIWPEKPMASKML